MGNDVTKFRGIYVSSNALGFTFPITISELRTTFFDFMGATYFKFHIVDLSGTELFSSEQLRIQDFAMRSDDTAPDFYTLTEPITVQYGFYIIVEEIQGWYDVNLGRIVYSKQYGKSNSDNTSHSWNGSSIDDIINFNGSSNGDWDYNIEFK